MRGFPRTEIGGVSVSRLIIGSNWFLGFSHTSKAKDEFIKARMTSERIADVIEVFLRAGVDTMFGVRPEAPQMQEAAKIAEDRVGRGIIGIATPHLNTGDEQADFDETARIFDAHAELGATFCMPHQCSTDALMDRRYKRIRNIDRYTALIRERGMVPGLSTHMPETPVYADATGADVETYIQIYNAAGFLMQIEVDWVHRMIWQAKKPVITIKPLAAGRLLPLVGLAFSWATLRPIDCVAVGCMTPDEARECIDISLSVLENRASAIELQKTRSKASLEA
ncbi:MAG: hypothetical protein ACLFV7_08420 [Phycisphaerae bacterium]